MPAPTTSATAPPLLQVRGLCFGYGHQALLQDFSMQAPAGLTVITADESAGKTTLMQLLAGTLPAHAGHLQINDISLAAAPEAYRHQVFWIDPRTDAFDTQTGRQFLQQMLDRYPATDLALREAMLEALGLEPHMDKKFNMMSTGSRRKFFLAAGFASGAKLHLLDCPFAALDRSAINTVLGWLAETCHHPTRAWVLCDYEAPAVDGHFQHLSL